jgi:4-hydroxybenzoate polyprenyl transferase
MEFIYNYIRLTRLNQPTGILLLFLPCLFGIFLALKKLSNPDFSEITHVIFLFFMGAFIMRCAGCVVNDVFDQKFDAKVARTKNRPLASGAVSQFGALIILGLLLLPGFIVLLQFNLKTILSGFIALALIVIYPLMKRITYYPQVFLGLTFNFGILMSNLAILQKITWETIILYVAAIIWTIIYDTIYAYQDIEDDLRIAVKSTAISFQKNPQKALIWLTFTMFLTLILLGWKCKFGFGFFLVILTADLLLNHKIKKCDFQNPQNCLKIFKENIWVGFLILIAIILG